VEQLTDHGREQLDGVSPLIVPPLAPHGNA
jgi:hypothetical protein